MKKIVTNAINGTNSILIYINNTTSVKPVTGYMGLCAIEDKKDFALTSNYELSKLLLIPVTNQNSADPIIDFLRGNTLFIIKSFATNYYFGIVWPSGPCNNPSILPVDSVNDATIFKCSLPAYVLSKPITENVIQSIFTGKTDVRFVSSGNSAWNDRYLGVCGYGPCKTLSVGLLPYYSQSVLRILSSDLHKINCCIDVTSISKCDTIPTYDCDPPMKQWCDSNKHKKLEECNCLNSKSLIPQCFDKDCYMTKGSYLKDKRCDRSYIDCVNIYATIDKSQYTNEIKSICGPYENLRNEYLEKGIYIKKYDLFGVIEDNWQSILFVLSSFALFIMILNIQS